MYCFLALLALEQVFMMQRYVNMMAVQRKIFFNQLIHKRIQVSASPAQVSVQVGTKKGTDFVSIPFIPMVLEGYFTLIFQLDSVLS